MENGIADTPILFLLTFPIVAIYYQHFLTAIYANAPPHGLLKGSNLLWRLAMVHERVKIVYRKR